MGIRFPSSVKRKAWCALAASAMRISSRACLAVFAHVHLRQPPDVQIAQIAARFSRALFEPGEGISHHFRGEAASYGDAVRNLARKPDGARPLGGDVERDPFFMPVQRAGFSPVVRSALFEHPAHGEDVFAHVVHPSGAQPQIQDGAVARCDPEQRPPARELIHRGDGARRRRGMSRKRVGDVGSQKDALCVRRADGA